MNFRGYSPWSRDLAINSSHGGDGVFCRNPRVRNRAVALAATLYRFFAKPELDWQLEIQVVAFFFCTSGQLKNPRISFG